MQHFPIGSSVTREALSSDPYGVFAHLRPTEPVTWAPALGQWLITSRNVAMDVLRDHDRFRTDEERSPIRDTFGPQMLNTEGEVQRRYKSACAPPFNARAVEESRALVLTISERNAAQLPKEVVELRTAYAAPIALETIARVIGLPEEMDVQLREWYEVFADALMNYERDADMRTRAQAAAKAFAASIAPSLLAPNESERSLLAGLAGAHPRLLDDAEIASNALIVLFGGIETTEGLIANAIWAILTHAQALERARASDDDLERCIEESLRWEPAVQTCTRYAALAGTLHNAAIPQGAVMQCMIGAMNRDPAHFARPDQFDPWRQESLSHTAFGFGRHFCLGAALARLEAQLAIRRLLAGFPSMRLDHERTLPPRGHEFRKPEALVVALS